jgi:glutamyl-tRNA reductase
MERFGLVGISHRRASAEEIGFFTKKPEQLEELRSALGVDELLLLSTCNRVEVYWVSHGRLSPDTVLRSFAAWLFPDSPELRKLADSTCIAMNGDAVHRHLNALLCGLDSLVLGDEQVVGQFRDALKTAREQEVCGQWLGMLADEALKLSRRIRQQIDFTTMPTSVSEVAADVLRTTMCGAGGRVVLVGSGEMTTTLAARLQKWNAVELHFVNRTGDKAAGLASRYGGTWQSLESFLESPYDFDYMVTATAAQDAVVSAQLCRGLPAQAHERLVLDLGVPADTEAAIAGLPGFTRLDVLEVGRRVEHNQQVAEKLSREARPYLREGSLHFREKIFRRNLGPVAQRLRESVETRAVNEAERWLATRLNHLGEEDSELFLAFARRLAEQTVQVPLIALRQTLRELPMGEALLQRLRDIGRRVAEEDQVR